MPWSPSEKRREWPGLLAGQAERWPCSRGHRGHSDLDVSGPGAGLLRPREGFFGRSSCIPGEPQSVSPTRLGCISQ